MVTKAMRIEAEEDIKTFSESINKSSYFRNMIKRDEKDVEGRRCIRNIDERIMNEMLDQITISNVILEPTHRATCLFCFATLVIGCA